MEINLAMGVHCPKCNLTIGTYSSMGGNTNCPNCNGKMIPAPAATQTRIIANFKCDCGMQIGYMTVMGEKAKCPGCHKEI
jgi:hypothetical protein